MLKLKEVTTSLLKVDILVEIALKVICCVIVLVNEKRFLVTKFKEIACTGVRKVENILAVAVDNDSCWLAVLATPKSLAVRKLKEKDWLASLEIAANLWVRKLNEIV